jgi:hypothetical protein
VRENSKPVNSPEIEAGGTRSLIPGTKIYILAGNGRLSKSNLFKIIKWYFEFCIDNKNAFILNIRRNY